MKMKNDITKEIEKKYVGKRFLRRKYNDPEYDYEFVCVQVIRMHWEEGHPLALVARIDDDECFPLSDCTEISFPLTNCTEIE
tara:strand:- start:45 stop:290 length:246 start_codon:yes stop_codon:yes gene_type:complete